MSVLKPQAQRPCLRPFHASCYPGQDTPKPRQAMQVKFLAVLYKSIHPSLRMKEFSRAAPILRLRAVTQALRYRAVLKKGYHNIHKQCLQACIPSLMQACIPSLVQACKLSLMQLEVVSNLKSFWLCYALDLSTSCNTSLLLREGVLMPNTF